MAKKSTNQTGEMEERKVPTMFRTRGQKKGYYVDKAIQHYITAEAEIKTILKMQYVSNEKLEKIKESVKKTIENTHNELYSYLSGKPMEKESNEEYEKLIKSLDEESVTE